MIDNSDGILILFMGCVLLIVHNSINKKYNALKIIDKTPLKLIKFLGILYVILGITIIIYNLY